ncbi:DUF2231 domain-containing protein [Cellulomonas sp. NPDC089187]|uniref:DUF2231 domain-containing protein n=1 Tax=Cellulomonas sp. NPDC089187 TaxID=3154970 RepID=UPI00343D6A79
MAQHAHEPTPLPGRLADTLEHAESLDPAVQRLDELSRPLLSHDLVRDLLHGRPLGHAAHPLLTDLPMGLWLSSVTLDLVGGTGARAAADRLLGLGVLSAAPASLSGVADWALGDQRVRRVGVVHAGLNSVATVTFAASWLLRRRGHRTAGVLASLLATGAVGAGGFLGGHLAFRQRSPRPDAADPNATIQHTSTPD